MALTQQQMIAIRAKWGEDISSRREVFGLTKPQLDAAIAAVDAWLDANAAAFNSALPAAARTGLANAQKAELLYLVALKRYG